MLTKLFQYLFKPRNERWLRKHKPWVVQINGFEESLKTLSDSELCGHTELLRQRYSQGESLEKLLPEAFALVREGSRRFIGLRHFDVQLLGGIALHQGKIAEMRTGEGKTLVATLPVYLNALTGDGVHVVTVNDYLANRDAEWMKPLYEGLGLSVGVITNSQEITAKQAAYQCDVCYGTNNEFGFDYLRDNMAFAPIHRVQRELNFAIIDEVDSVLIDEARTPLVISGQSENSSRLYQDINSLIPRLLPEKDGGGHFTIDEKHKQVELTEEGFHWVENELAKKGVLPRGESLYAANHLNLLHHVYSALRAYKLYHLNVEYIVEDREIMLIDEHTGRTMPNRRLAEGLHQALEAKENLPIQSESKSLASITFQNFFRQYYKLAGMTGTAETEAREFHQIYNLEVLIIPTHKNMIRDDCDDLIFMTHEEKFNALVENVQECLTNKSPVLIGTTSVENSEEVSKLLQSKGIAHKVLNAKHHAQEAEIIAQAGKPGAVTIATNMAGRGTDIVLGGNLEAQLASLKIKDESKLNAQRETLTKTWQEQHDAVVEAGGLHIFATERHESRRIDNQLRGRAGRQGDPGLSRFYLSMDDNLLRIFVTPRMKEFMQSLGVEPGEALEHRLVSRSIERAQRRVEERNFDLRKQLLEYDDIANEQRQVIYRQRCELLEQEDVTDIVDGIRQDVVHDILMDYVPPESVAEEWEIENLEKHMFNELGVQLSLSDWCTQANPDEAALYDKVNTLVEEHYTRKKQLGGSQLIEGSKHVLLGVLDMLWQEHLTAIEHLRQGIHLRAYAQKNPKQEYKRESFELFGNLLEQIKHETTRMLARIDFNPAVETEQNQAADLPSKATANSGAPAGQAPVVASPALPTTSASSKAGPSKETNVGRNDPCPCGSGKKYKRCCL